MLIEKTNGLTDPQEPIVEAQDDPTTEGQNSDGDDPITTDPVEGVKGQEVAKPVKKEQSPEDNTAFKEMRLKMEAIEAEKNQAKRDAKYSKKYPDLDFESESDLAELYGDQGIKTYEDLDNWYKIQEEAEQVNVDANFYREFKSLSEEVTSLKSEKEMMESEKKLEPLKQEYAEKYGKAWSENEEEILSLARQIGPISEATLQASVATILSEKLPGLLKEIESMRGSAKDEIIKEYIAKKKNEKPTEGSGTSPVSVGDKPKSSWESARQDAINVMKGGI